jgi:hypothetical protein
MEINGIIRNFGKQLTDIEIYNIKAKEIFFV